MNRPTTAAEDLSRMHKLIAIIEQNPKAEEHFKNPVDFISLGLLDYPVVISHPMDLATVKVKRWHLTWEG